MQKFSFFVKIRQKLDDIIGINVVGSEATQREDTKDRDTELSATNLLRNINWSIEQKGNQ